MHRELTTSRLVTALTAVIALLLLAAAPALAGSHDTRSDGRSENPDNSQRRDPNGGNSDSAPRRGGGSGTTEDNDDDGDDDRDNAGRRADGSGTYPNPSQHPSGKDRYQEGGGSGNQGNSGSDPDDDGRGPDRGTDGPDKPGGSGGVDPYDQDGNNGCGNDQDFEDDNEGWCGRNPKRNNDKGDADETEDAVLVAIKSCPETGSMVPVNEDCSPVTTELDTIELDQNLSLRGAEDEVAKVLGVKIARDVAAAQPASPEVLGVRLSPALSKSVVVAGAVLPFTGGELLVFVALALGLVGAGAATLMLRRRES